MNFRKAILLGILPLFGSSVYAQNAQKVEVFGEYSYLRVNPTLSYLKNRSFNGGGGVVQYNFKEYFGFKAEFMGYMEVPTSLFQQAPTTSQSFHLIQS